MVTTNSVIKRIEIISIIKVSSPQNQMENTIHLEADIIFLLKKIKGVAVATITVANRLLILDLCSWGEIEATLIKKMSSPPMNTIT